MNEKRAFALGVLSGITGNAIWSVLLPYFLMAMGAVSGFCAAWLHGTEFEQAILYTLAAVFLLSALFASALRFRFSRSRAKEDSSQAAHALLPPPLGEELSTERLLTIQMPSPSVSVAQASEPGISEIDRIQLLLPHLAPAEISYLTSLELRPGIGMPASSTVQSLLFKRIIEPVSSFDPVSYLYRIRPEIATAVAAWLNRNKIDASQRIKDDSPTLLERQVVLAAEHNRLLAAQLQPVFRFVYGVGSRNSEAFETLEVWNDGEPIPCYSVWQGSYIEVERRDIEPHATRYYPAYYFNHREYAGDQKTGLLFRYSTGGNPVNPANKTMQFKRLKSEVQERFGFKIGIKKRVYLEIYYTDRAEADHCVTYDIFPESYTLEAPRPRRCDNMYLGMVVPFDLGAITAEQLVQYWDSGSALPGFAKRPAVTQ